VIDLEKSSGVVAVLGKGSLHRGISLYSPLH